MHLQECCQSDRERINATKIPPDMLNRKRSTLSDAPLDVDTRMWPAKVHSRRPDAAHQLV